jgi:hypothetical protein
MSDFEPTRTNRTVVLNVEVSTDEELAAVHEALSRSAVGYICDGLDAVVYVEDEEDGEGLAVALVKFLPDGEDPQ